MHWGTYDEANFAEGQIGAKRPKNVGEICKDLTEQARTNALA
jgi:hypothetical protein